jgi:serine/threonine protein kinase
VPGCSHCPFCGHPYHLRRTVTDSPRHALGPARRPHLVSVGDPSAQQRIPISTKQFSIGRGGSNYLQLEGLLVSRQHALIAVENDQFVLYDRESTNGTYVNGHRVARHLLRSGDQIQVGPSIFLFEVPGEPAPSLPLHPPRVPTPSPPHVTSQDLGDYRLLEKIGSGGAATVYKATLRSNGQTVAVKILHEADPYIRDKFEQEGYIGERLRHPHIARVRDHGVHGTSFYLVMDYVDGGSLRDKLLPGQPLPWDSVILIMGQTAEALDYAHSEGVVHRDIKPENIMFSSQGVVRVVDFGIAKVTSSLTRTTDGLIVGTPYYLSFEQAKGLPVDRRSDIYSLGVVLYEMIAGQLPFEGEPLEVIHKHITQNPIPPSRLNPSVPPQFEAATLRALRKRPRERFQTAGEMASALGYAAAAYRPSPIPVRESIVSTTAHLTVVVGPRRGSVIDLASQSRVLSRREIDEHDMLISREHARVLRQGQQSWLEDLDSTNGTFLNGQRIFGTALLRDGDEIRMGNAVLRLQI